MNDLIPLVTALATVAALMFGFFKWFVGWAERRHEAHERRFEMHDRRIAKNETSIDATREEMHRDFVRQSALDRLREEQRQDFALVFERMDQQSRQLNQLVGAIKGKKNV
jgi:uncharacterized membrane protein YhiD involved in acid resistance